MDLDGQMCGMQGKRDSRLQDYLAGLVKQIDEYDGENWIDFKSDWTIPSPEAEM